MITHSTDSSSRHSSYIRQLLNLGASSKFSTEGLYLNVLAKRFSVYRKHGYYTGFSTTIRHFDMHVFSNPHGLGKNWLNFVDYYHVIKSKDIFIEVGVGYNS